MKPVLSRHRIKRTPSIKRTVAEVLACVAGVERGRGRGNLGARVRESVWGARGGKERNACKNAIVLSVFYAQILSVKIVIGQN